MLQRPSDPDRLNGCGLVVVNAPYTLRQELAAVLPELSRRLASGGGGAGYRLDRIEPSHAGSAPPPETKRRMRTRP
jgi:23S rRNA (adenine2030-N6)-methyltransferase